MNPVLVIARKAFKDGLRSRWLVSLTGCFFALSLALALFGSAATGTLSLARWQDTLSTLATLAAVLIPLIAIQLSFDSFVGEREEGTLLLMLSYPLHRRQILLGKFAGQGGILALTALMGFGLTGLILFVMTPEAQRQGLGAAFALFILSAVLLGWVFIALGYWVSLGAQSKGQAAAKLFALWFGFVLLYDLLLLGLLVGQGSGAWGRGLILLNPVDLFRLLNLMAMEHESVTGVLSLFRDAALGPGWMLLAMLAWLGALLWQAQRRLSRLSL
ncbi:ABC transporter permease [Ferrimonas balearica]|uniref:ABC transporter permease n=1 Tax=Ferrimonas balearica TaxID=44012 RepID=UPI001C9A20AA|nr:ABC transporter permease subunit [Ferrimonas balearica]MBY5991360.1 ABC transporter permease [Ferrimonas balearica]